MSVIIDKYSLFYAPVPKVACTSLKLMFFEIENGFPFRSYTANGARRHIHHCYPTTLRSHLAEQQRVALFDRFTVVRNPVDRFLSAYSNRVVHHKELSQQAAGSELKRLRLETNPGIDLFIKKFEKYPEASKAIRHHLRPMVDFLGKDASYFSKVYSISELDLFVSDLRDRIGLELTIGRHQTGGPKIRKEDLTKRQLAKIKNFYSDDYTTFASYF